MLGISWLDQMSNETVLRKADRRRELIIMIAVTQMRFLGHVNRKKEIEYLTTKCGIKVYLHTIYLQN